VKEKHQSNQERDDVLRRMLRTAPQPKTGGKSLKNLDKNGPDNGVDDKPLRRLRESESKK
jgi:hypothetical protein